MDPHDNQKGKWQWLFLNESPLNQAYITKRRICVFDGVLAESFVLKCR